MRVKDRLIKELQLYAFAVIPAVQRAVFVDDKCNLRLKNSFKISDDLNSQYVFAVSFGNGNRYESSSMNSKFKFPCRSIMNSISDSLRVNVYCRAKDKSFGFLRICSFFLREYHLSIKRSLIISESIKVRSFEPNVGVGGCLSIKSASDVMITDSGSIITDSCMSRRPDMDSRVGITLISEGSITNEGILYCKSLSGQQRGARSIYLVAHSIINHGNIQCDSENDEIYIICSEFENTGNVSVGEGKDERIHIMRVSSKQIGMVLNVVIQSSGSALHLAQALKGKCGGERMILKYEKHKKHCSDWEGEHHPRNLLEEGPDEFYKSGHQSVVGDWIIFRLRDEERVFPTRIGIRNTNDIEGVRAVSISGSADNKKFKKLVAINDIHNEDEDMQMFDIDPKYGLVACNGQFKYFRLRVLQNHGSRDWNIFCEFRIYGVKL